MLTPACQQNAATNNKQSKPLSSLEVHPDNTSLAGQHGGEEGCQPKTTTYPLKLLHSTNGVQMQHDSRCFARKIKIVIVDGVDERKEYRSSLADCKSKDG